MIGRKILLRILRLVEVAGGELVDHTLQVALLEDRGVLWFAGELGHRVGSHEFEDTALRLIEECGHFVKTPDHLFVLADSTGHAASKSVAEVVVNVELAWGSRCQESIVKT
jgi:hypothetical protein